MSDPIPAAEITDELLQRARTSAAQRAARTLFGGGQQIMRQTAIALLAGAELAEHESPGEATLYVIRGQVEITSEAGSSLVDTGEIVQIPPQRHSLRAVSDAVVLLSAVPREHVPEP